MRWLHEALRGVFRDVVIVVGSIVLAYALIAFAYVFTLLRMLCRWMR